MTQKENIKQHLLKGKPITQLQALDLYGCMRLAPVIHKLRNEDMSIKTVDVPHNGSSYAKYYIQYPQQSIEF